MINRRDFLKTAAAAGVGLLSPVTTLGSRHQSTEYFNVHPFIESHPEAVFIMRTNVSDKMNAEEKLQAGLAFGRSAFVPSDESGVPLNITIPVKPNFLNREVTEETPLEDVMSTSVDTYFLEGLFEGMKELGIKGEQFRIRDSSSNSRFASYGHVDMAERVGASLRLIMDRTNLIPGVDYNLIEVPDGVWFKKMPKLEPFCLPDTWMLNIAKFKAHGLAGYTLCCKNLQGSLMKNYQRLCCDPPLTTTDLNRYKHAGVEERLQADFERHLAEGIIPRWEYQTPERVAGGPVSGLNHEYWCNRTLDNVSITPSGLYIIEGIYGRDGDSGSSGPHPLDQEHVFTSRGGSSTGKAMDWMSNIIVFGKNIFHVDIIGYWLGGSEPGNFGFFHIARERGMSNILNPRSIPVYFWDPVTSTATLTPLEDIERKPLLTYYMANDYGLIDEPFDYKQVGVDECPQVCPDTPKAFVLHQNRPNPFNPYTTIEYQLPQAGYTRLEIYNVRGQLVDVLVDTYREQGSHMAVWNTQNHASGTYFYRFRFSDVTRTRKMALLK